MVVVIIVIKQMNNNVILRFDLVSKQFSTVPLTDSSLVCSSSSIQLCVINGRLLLMRSHNNNSSDVWMLKQQQHSGVWQKLFSIDRSMRLVAVFDNWKCLVKYPVYYYDNNSASSELKEKERKQADQEFMIVDPYHPYTSKVSIQTQPNFDYRFLMILSWNYGESLVSPF